MFWRGIFGVAIFVALAGSAAAQQEGHAEIPRGLWETPLDATGVLFHVRTRRCGRALCGRVERAKNRRGYDTPSNAVGDKFIWNMRPHPDGSFFGEYRDPQANSYSKSRVNVVGKELRLEACNDNGCRKEVWKRIR